MAFLPLKLYYSLRSKVKRFFSCPFCRIASYLAMTGANLKTIHELLGHKSYLMTLRYAHLSGDYKKEVVDRLGQQIVTIWSQGPISIDEVNMLKSLGVNQDKELAVLSRDGGMADAKDLKSFEEKSNQRFFPELIPENTLPINGLRVYTKIYRLFLKPSILTNSVIPLAYLFPGFFWSKFVCY